MNVTRTPPKTTTVLRTFKNASSIGATEVIAAVGSGSIRVVGIAFVSTATNTVKFQSGTTDISATFPLGANGGVVLSFNEHGWFQTNAGEALNINMTAATATAIQVSYIVV